MKYIFDRLETAAPAVLLCAAVLLAGLRFVDGWLAFALLFLLWAVFSRRPFAPRLNVSAALYLAWLCAAAAFSPWPVSGLLPLAGGLLPVLFFFTALSSGEGADYWLYAVLALGAAAAATLLAQGLSGAAPTGFIGLNPNYTAAFAAAALPPALLLAAGDGGRLRNISLALAPVLILALLSGSSRGALLGASAASAAALWLAGRRRAIAALALGAAAALLLLPQSFWGGMLKLQDPRAFERPQLWLAALRAAADSPLLGWGPGQFGRVFELFKFPYFDGVSNYGHITPHAHGELFNLAAGAGLPGLIFFAAAAFAGLRAGARRNLPLAAAAFAVLVQGCVDLTFYSGAVALLFWGCLGFSATGSSASGNTASGGLRLRLALAALCAVLVPASAAVSGGAAAAYRAAAARAADTSPALELALARRAALVEPYNAYAARAAGAAAGAAGDQAQAERWLLAAVALEPEYSGARLDLAWLYAAAGRRDACLEQARRIQRRRPAGRLSAYQAGLLLTPEEAKELVSNPCAPI